MKPRSWLTLSLTVLLLASAGVIGWLARRSADRDRGLQQAGAENQQLRARVADLNRQLAERAAAQAPRREEVEPSMAKRPEDGAEAKAVAEAARFIQRLQDSLAQANASIHQLENRTLDLQAQVGRLTADNERLTTSESDLNESLAASKRLVDALQRELKGKSDRLVQMEISDQKLRQQTAADAQRQTQLTQAISELREVYLRQEATLKRILSRYRDVTDQYRSISSMLDNRRGDPGAMTSIDLSRIQNSIALAEEDLRQFDSLSAQVQRIQRKLTVK